MDYGHFIYNLNGNSGQDVEVTCTHTSFLVDFKDLGQTDMETYIAAPKLVALEQVKKFKRGDYGTSLGELDYAWLNLSKGRDHDNRDPFYVISLKDWEFGYDEDEGRDENYSLEFIDGDLMVTYDAVPLSIAGGLTKVCLSTWKIYNYSSRCRSCDPPYTCPEDIYNLFSDYIWFSESTDGNFTIKEMFGKMRDNEPDSIIDEFVESGYVALMYKKIVQSIANTNTIATNLKRKAVSYEFSEFYYFGPIRVTWEVVFNIPLGDGLYKTATFTKFKAVNVKENKEIKGDVSINYETWIVPLSVVTGRYGRFVLTSGLGERVDVAEEFAELIEKSDNKFLRAGFNGDFTIYLTTENGIRYKFTKGM